MLQYVTLIPRRTVTTPNNVIMSYKSSDSVYSEEDGKPSRSQVMTSAKALYGAGNTDRPMVLVTFTLYPCYNDKTFFFFFSLLSFQHSLIHSSGVKCIKCRTV